MSRKPIIARTKPAKPTVAIVGAGRLAGYLATALHAAGFAIDAIIIRESKKSRSRARALAKKTGAQIVNAQSAKLKTDVLWLCVPDIEIKRAASALAANSKCAFRFAFHSSGALRSSELTPLRTVGAAIASVHPLMTFVAKARTSLVGVPFALEGDVAAMRLARRIVRALGGVSFTLPGSKKAAYHAWATMSSPLFVAFLTVLEEAAGAAGLSRAEARRKSLPILRQTLINYSRFGAAKSFSGPLVRGDAGTIAKHLAALKKDPGVRDVYLALARAALRHLPTRNRSELKQQLGS